MEIKSKYDFLRPQIKNGSIILVRGKSLLAKTIEWADGAYFSHALTVYQSGGRNLAIQSLANGVVPSFLSTEVLSNVDFCVLNPKFPQLLIDDCIQKFLNRAESGVPYNFWELPKILIKEKLGIKFKNMQGNTNDAICSVSAGIIYGGLLPLTCYTKPFNERGYLTPQDLLRFLSTEQLEITGDEEFIASGIK